VATQETRCVGKSGGISPVKKKSLEESESYSFILSRTPHETPDDDDPFSLCVIHKEGPSPSSGDINKLMMMMMIPSIYMTS
jgi:hypothetical protein